MTHWSKRLDERRRALGWSQRELAKRAGLDENLVRKYHQGVVDNPRGHIMAALAKVLGVSQIWLEHGKVPQSMTLPVIGFVGPGEIYYPEPHAKVALDICADQLDLFCVRITGESGLPVYRPGEMVVCSRAAGTSENRFINRDCAVFLKDGRAFLKRVTKGSKALTYNLISYNAEPIEGVSIDWVAPVVMVIRDPFIINGG